MRLGADEILERHAACLYTEVRRSYYIIMFKLELQLVTQLDMGTEEVTFFHTNSDIPRIRVRAGLWNSSRKQLASI